MSTILPKTYLGKCSIGLIIIFFIFFVAIRFTSNLPFQLIEAAILPLVAFGALSFFTGIISVIKNKERSILVFLSTAMGLYVLIYWVGASIF